MWDVIIIGAGVIGSALARELSRYQLEILVLEKEEDVCEVTSMANSGIVHSGYDPKPGTLKAKLNVLGNSLFPKLSQELGFDFKPIGSLTIALREEDLPVLKELQANGFKNGVETKIINKEELFKLEPNLNKEATYALFAPTAGIVNPFEYTVALMENALDNGATLKLEEEVKAINKNAAGYLVITNKASYQTKIVINAAGLKTGEIAKMVDCDITIRPRKGEYFVLNQLAKPLVNHVIFPLPSEKGKGILLTPTTSMNYLVGPSSDYIDDLDDFSTDAKTLALVKVGASKLIQDLPYHEVIRSFAGLRAVHKDRDFILKEDEKNPNFYHAAGIESPGLAASYAIAIYLVDLIKKRNKLLIKPNFNPYRRPFIKLKDLSLAEKNKYYHTDKSFAKIVCRCEKISEGEILDAIRRKAGARTVRGVKKRVRPGFGKCQGGFCESLVLEILRRELKLAPTQVLYGKKDSEVIKFITKEACDEKI